MDYSFERQANLSSSVPPELYMLRMLLVEALRFQQPVRGGRASIVEVMKQVDQLWAQLIGSPSQKYEFIRSRLTGLFLWDNVTENLPRNIMQPPLSLLEYYRAHQVFRLHSLPPGSLFHFRATAAVNDN